MSTENNKLFDKLFSYIDYLKIIRVATQDAPEPILLTTSVLEGDGPEIIFANKSMCQVSGYSFKEIVGKSPRILQGIKTTDSFKKSLKSTLLDKKVFEGETVNYKKDGTPYNVRLIISPIYDQHGILSNYIGLHQVLN